MAGNQDRIHGYNTLYQVNDAVHNNLQFQSFEVVMKGQRQSVDKFVNRVVVQNPVAAQPVLDHQGHVVPQGLMNTVLDPLMIAMSAACHSAADVNVYIANAAHNAVWLAPAVAYAVNRNIDVFDFSEPDAGTLATAEARLGDLFSLITWNPVNICRAPDDVHRNGVPGNAIDHAVIAWLNQAGVSAAWLAAVNVLAAIAAPTPADVRTYLTASTATLEGQQAQPTGYYSFAWNSNAGVLSPP
jgi:hypothetical protein